MTAQRSGKYTDGDTCAYCNVNASEPGVGDHVIPRGLFDPKSHSTMRVPACRPCNDLKSRSEDYVRDWLCSHYEVDDAAIPPRVYAAFMRSSGRNKSKLVRTAATRGRYVHTYTEHGLYLGKLLRFDLESIRIVQTFELIAQGVYYDVTREHLPRDGAFDVGYVPRMHIAEQVQMLKGLDATTYDLGKGTCTIVFAAGRTPDRIVARVLLAFYNKSVAVDVLYTRGPAGHGQERENKVRPSGTRPEREAHAGEIHG